MDYHNAKRKIDFVIQYNKTAEKRIDMTTLSSESAILRVKSQNQNKNIDQINVI